MQLNNLRIRNFRTIGSEQVIDLTNGLTIVGPNSTGKTNILKAIEMVFTGPSNVLGYDLKRDFTFDAKGQTTLSANFSCDSVDADSEFFRLYSELNSLLEEPRDLSNDFQLYISFATNTGNPSYRFFSNQKIKKDQNTNFSRKQAQAVNLLLDSFVCHYVPSSKSTGDLYQSLLLPFIKRSVTRTLADKVADINSTLAQISKQLDAQLAIANLGHITSHFSLPNDSLEELIDKFEFNLSDPNKTSIERKGMGIQASAILASFLWITNEESKLGKQTIWLIEEPESYLHPQLAEACHKMLEKLRDSALLVTTTHSLGFVNRDPRKLVGTELDNGFTKVVNYDSYLKATSSIRSALGVRFSDYYNLNVMNVFVEGKSEREVFSWILDSVSPNYETGEFIWPHLRNASFIDFTGVSGMEGFMKATYEFIHKERAVVTVLDGDQAGSNCRRNLQQFLGNKDISFEPNIDFVSLHNGFALEGLFPDNWIIELHSLHPNWFKSFSLDFEGNLQPFDMKTQTNKVQLRNNLQLRAKEEHPSAWSSRFVKLFDMLDNMLEKQHQKVYGGSFEDEQTILYRSAKKGLGSTKIQENSSELEENQEVF
ncbi:ATPase_AAA_core domain-containing protein [Vibrio chagasii]|uniref:ATP-dependent nuclease n=1 Tax=Vibrio TaxID=662 RepID=UPI00063392D6|nr:MULTISPECIES: AAA family ATPase [Vibrio]CAH6908100.1 ATPase_AAA_core domain-containing protein [Vibrio chagasii]NOI94510.1 ATP-binding protein [Vibrio sp. T3Y01]CAH7014606.1 ATPase_AAA_core domain-containing protein [Vibrio chagasii]CAH7052470.1 ATPase_AAA_core domain-containing protein [Vibrio chagasii]CAH7082628.1 ATPase_AAA_core domain-containing protein [Vibrio chagasii]